MGPTPSAIPSTVSPEDSGRLLLMLRDLLRIDRADDAARRVCAAVREVVGADGATFVVRDGDEVHYAEEDAVDALWRGRRFPASACISGWAVIHGQTAVIEDICEDPRIPPEAYRPTFVKSLCMTPASRERPLGAIGAYWAKPHRADEREVWLLEQIADVAYSVLRREVDQPSSATPPEGPLARLLAVVAHDLRQPLSTIAQGAELLLEDTEGTARDVSERVARSARHATELVGQVLDLSHHQHGRLPLRVEEVAVDELCRAVARDVDREGARVALELRPARAMLDADRFRQVVVNLVRNALHHGDRSRRVTLRVAPEADRTRVEVHNHGPTIPAERRETIFRAFSQFDGQKRSTGLGLYIAEQIVRAHGGMLELSSSDGEGTTFAVTVPVGASTLDVA